MTKDTQTYDTIIIGSGLGGLICANLLAMEGQRVCVLEKNEQIGGNLQTFKRDGVTFDTGVHYISGLDKGQNLHTIFNYLGLLDRLEIKKMNIDKFDTILFGNDDETYCYAMGYDRFIASLSNQFPTETLAIKQYCNDIKEMCSHFPMYHLQSGNGYKDESIFELSAFDYFEKLTQNETLKAVLAGTNILYAGEKSRTPFYMHALMINSYIESTWKCMKGGDQIAKLLAKSIKALGGKIITKQEITSISEVNGKVENVKSSSGNTYHATNFISNIAPSITLDLLDSKIIRRVYKDRIKNIKNTPSAFSVYIILKPESVKYQNRNFYYFEEKDVWNAIEKSTQNWPYTYALYECCSPSNPTYCDGLILLAYMDFEEVKKWEGSINTTLDEQERGEEYLQFKEQRTQQLFDLVEKKFPDFRQHIKSYYTSTPLSFRDYIGTTDGNMYGIAKDFRDPMQTRISPVTKIPNLFFTGANINIHGVLGVSISALVTTSFIVGKEHLLSKINSAR